MVCETAEGMGGARIEVVHLRLGVFAGVVKDALLFSFEVATEGTLAEGAVLDIEEIPLVVYCDACQRERTLPCAQAFVCPSCGSPTPEVRRGRELEVTTIEVQEVEDGQHDAHRRDSPAGL